MLSKAKVYIRFLVTSIIVLVFTVLIIMDLVTFMIDIADNNYKYQNVIGLQRCANIENLYIEVSKKASIEEIDSNLKVERLSDQDSIEDSLNIEEIQNSSSNQSSELEIIRDVSSVGSANMYSTNKWRVKIPKLKLDAPITEGTTQEALRRTVGHFEQTDKWEGNVALAGHNRGYRCNFFQDIKTLQIGDIIIYLTEKGERKYRVVINKIIEETDWTYIKNTTDNRITLITCETNRSAYRRCIQAVEIK